MKKGEVTREMILKKAAALFNTEGYTKASLSDIMAATGLEKGGIYNHFGSKEQLMLESFDYAVRCAGGRVKEMVDEAPDTAHKLLAFVTYFTELHKMAAVPGGCPVMNAAIESDDSIPELKERARGAMAKLLKYVESIIEEGKTAGELKKDLDANASAINLIASLEGGLMLTKLFGGNAKSQALKSYWTNEISSWKRR